ncbi:MAG: hypothetical protein HGB03_03520 [Candidatus Yonathbacteria bacterium]|nr:hypothetical protein [Candidatus Yonathbacteria bacterium]NTW47692.1 hypothetical protein [Candidatus Yonathbacteria bacterium]
MAKYDVTGNQHFGITGQMLEIQRQIRLKGGSPIDPELVTLALQDIIEGKFHHTQASKADNAILRLISKGETIVIDVCDGSETLATAKEVFPGIDGDFKNWGTNKAGIATKEQVVDVHELVKDATFAQMFGSLGTDLDKLCLTQAQIKNFCKKHFNWLRTDGYPTFFLFKVEDQFFVAYVLVHSDGLRVYVRQFEDVLVCSAVNSHRLVVPQLTA